MYEARPPVMETSLLRPPSVPWARAAAAPPLLDQTGGLEVWSPPGVTSAGRPACLKAPAARRGEARRRQRSLMQLIPTQKNEVARFNRGVLCVFPTSSDPTSSLLLLHTPSPHPPQPEAHCGVYLMADDFPFARRLHSARSAPGPQREEGGAPSLN